jgi:hypothetical protein
LGCKKGLKIDYSYFMLTVHLQLLQPSTWVYVFPAYEKI